MAIPHRIIPDFTDKQAARFWSYVLIREEADDCWPWIGSTAGEDGYGKFKHCKKTISSHRIAYTLARGQIVNGLLVCHKCDNKVCCNPNHLFLGTTSENFQDMLKKGRANKASGARNGMKTKPETAVRGEVQWNAKLTADKVRYIRARRSAGLMTIRELADELHVNTSTVWSAVKRKSWKHIE